MECGAFPPLYFGCFSLGNQRKKAAEKRRTPNRTSRFDVKLHEPLQIGDGLPQGLSGFGERQACFHQTSIPAIQADMKLAMVPAATALRPRRAKSDLRVGASAPMPPIWIAIELKFANPHKA